MTLDIQVEPFGPAAARALARLIAAAQGDDPLARVTVVVPRSTVGLATRRLLAFETLGEGSTECPGGRGPGLINVQFTTAARLLADLGGSWLAEAGRSPALPAALAAAARAALARSDSARCSSLCATIRPRRALFVPPTGISATCRPSN